MNGPERKTVLLVDDDAIIALTAARTIGGFGYAVITAHTGEKAVEIAALDPAIDLVLMDIDLGKGIDGPEAANLILRERNLPIVFLTGHSEKEYVDRVKEITRYGYILKDAGDFVLRSSIEMAFELFDANRKKQETMNKLEATLDALPDLLFEIGLDGRYYEIHARRPELLFRPTGEMSGKIVFDILPPTPAAIVMSAVREAHKNGFSFGKQYELTVPAGTRWFEIAVSRMASAADQPHFVFLARDITESKISAQALSQEQTLLRSLLDSTSDDIYFKDRQSRFIRTSKAHAESVGLDDPALMVGKTDFDYYAEEHARQAYADEQWVIKTGKPLQKEEREIWNDRSDTWVLTERMPLRDAEGSIVGTLGISKDITQRKLAEQEVEDTASRYREFIESAPVAFFRSDSNGRLYSTNVAMATLLGFRTGQEAAEYYTDVATQMYTDPAKRQELLALLREHGSVSDFVYQLRTRDGRKIWIRTTARISERRADGTFIIEGFSSDITENVRAEEETKRVAREYETVFHGAQDSIFLMEVTGPNQFRYTRNNLTHERTTGLTTAAIRGKTPRELLGQELGETVSTNYQRCVDAKVPISYEETLELPAGRRTWATTLTPIIREGRVTHIVGSSQDITERRAAEEKIGGLLQEKELLLREVHHRIKNNMNTMSSLLSLQADAVKDSATVLALQDARSRMRSMGVLYDKLFLTENLREMSITEYLPTLADEIVKLFPVPTAVKLEKQIDDFVLPVKELTSVGIIVNELLTNIMKHAFVGRAEGKITVFASKTDQRITIGVGDDGVGIPDSFNLEHSTGFGLMVIRALTKQLNGTVQIDRTNGTYFLLEFDTSGPAAPVTA